MDILIKEIDVLAFGDGKPFNSGENFFRASFNDIFNIPIYSSMKQAIYKNLQIEYISLVKNKKNFILPFPMDLQFRLKLKENKIFPRPLTKNKFKDYKYLYYKYLSKGIFFNYLKNELIYNLKETLEYNAYTNILSIDGRTGIQLDRYLKTTEKGKLYIQNFLNLSFTNKRKNFNKDVEEIYIYVKLKNLDNISGNIMELGGESKLAKIEIIDTDLVEKNFKHRLKAELKEKIKTTNYFKIILLTPTNYPPDIEKEFNGKVKRIAQLIGKPIAFSGWFNVYDGDKKIDSFPSRLFKLIPAGSVFYYKIDDEITKDDKKLEEFTEKLFEKYWLKPSFFVPEYPYFEKAEDGTNPLGFGLSIIGVAQVEES